MKGTSSSRMKVQVLGCHGAELGNRKTCGFKINDCVLLDAGTICSALSLSEQRNIRHILVSHAHLDHTKGLASFSENLHTELTRTPVTLFGLQPILDALQNHLFNDHLWPDFTRLPNKEKPVLHMQVLSEGETYQIDDLEITAFAVNHTVPSSGFIIRRGNTSMLYSGDTHQTENLWKAAAKEPFLKAALIEVSFPNALVNLARESKHLTPALFQKEFSKMGKPRLPVYAYHMKPKHLKEIERELEALALPHLTLLKDGMTFEL